MLRFLIAMAMLACASSEAHAVTLWVNGDTPSVRYQRWVDAMQISLPDERVTLKLADSDVVDVVCEEPAGGCIRYDEQTVWLAIMLGTTPTRPGMLREILEHEMGHLVAERFAPEDRARVLSLLRETRPWRSPPNSPHEMAADLVMVCAARGVWLRKLGDGEPRIWTRMELTAKRLRVICPVIRAAAARATGS